MEGGSGPLNYFILQLQRGGEMIIEISMKNFVDHSFQNRCAKLEEVSMIPT